MINIIQNEISKIFSRKKIYIFISILFIVALINLLNSLITRNLFASQDYGQTFPLLLFDSVASLVIPIFVVVLIASMVTDEYLDGSLKLTLLRKVSRNQLLLGKMGALFVVLFLLLLFLLIVGYTIGISFFGWGKVFLLKGKELSSSQGILFTLSVYTTSLLSYISFGMIILLFSVTIDNSGSVVALGLVTLISWVFIGEIFHKISPYLITDYFNTYNLFISNPSKEKIIFSFGVIFLYSISFYLLSFKIFNNKDLLK